MAFWIDPSNLIFLYSDDKLAFPDWVEQSAERKQNWEKAVDEHNQWIVANPDKPKQDAEGLAAQIFQEWIEYANAQEIAVPNTP